MIRKGKVKKKADMNVIERYFEARSYVETLEHRHRYLEMLTVRNGYQQKEFDALSWAICILKPRVQINRDDTLTNEQVLAPYEKEMS